VRGELYLAAENLRKAGREIIFTNVGNPQALGQKPITFNRQVPTVNYFARACCRNFKTCSMATSLPWPNVGNMSARRSGCQIRTSPAVLSGLSRHLVPLAHMQVHALVAAPFLLDHPNIADMFPADAITRAKLMLQVRRVAGAVPRYIALPPRVAAWTTCLRSWVAVGALPHHLKACT